jgi:hypothetical protein
MSKVNPELMQVRRFKLVPLCAQFKDLIDEQAKINKDVVTKFESMEKILENLDGKVTEAGSSIREVFIMMETQVGQLVGRPMGNKGEFPRQPQGPKKAKATQTHSGEMEDHTKRPQRSRPKDRSLRCRATT